MDGELGEIFLRFSIDKLSQLAGRIQACLGRLTSEQVWARGSENENAVGNLVLHLCGNVRQWVGFGIAGWPDIRVREQEFAARGGLNPQELGERLDRAVQEAVSILRALPSARLGDRTRVQNYDLTVLEAIYHVVEHFAGHTGQILYATKQMTHEDLGFYRHLSGPQPHGETTP
ncbi:MAG: DinB family protein [Bryobacterales bacterium]|nr:DUF1572 domain-containing protein [Bryobacteraceae bacterium]MDW8356014.1 DinB family protein [Bryobacterales bacterium]